MKASINAIKQYEKAHLMEKDGKIEEILQITNNENTMIGALSKYISTPNKHFEPMNANYGILPKLDENIKDKKQKYLKLSNRSLENFKILQTNSNTAKIEK